MSRKISESLLFQAKQKFDLLLRIGEKKRLHKIDDTYKNYIFSWNTYRTYLKQTAYFLKWCKNQPIKAELGHKPRTIDECKLYAKGWLQYNANSPTLSAYTVSLRASALAKLYNCSVNDFEVELPKRLRVNITRSRSKVENDKHFSETLHADLVTFCKCTGLRRAELQQIRGTDLTYIEGKPYLNITKNTKGGRPRCAPICGSAEEVANAVKMLQKSGNDKVFPHVSRHADIHSYRSDYAQRVYNIYARNEDEYKKERIISYRNSIVEIYTSTNGLADKKRFGKYYDKNGKLKHGYKDVSSCYICRADRKPMVLDRMAMFFASSALGHNRETIIAGHYLKLE